jgi:hypothetical protein
MNENWNEGGFSKASSLRGRSPLSLLISTASSISQVHRQLLFMVTLPTLGSQGTILFVDHLDSRLEVGKALRTKRSELGRQGR